jgi:uncharacterized protein (TIRG00374 family)
MWLAALVLFVWALSRVSFVEAWRVVGNLDARAVAALVAINLVALVVYGARWWILLRGLGHPIALAHAACYRLAGFGFAYFTPGPQVGGEPAQVVLVERRHRVPRDVAIASVMLDRLFDGVLNLAFLAAAALVVLEGRLALMLAVFVAVPLGYLAAITLGRKPLSAVVRAAIVHESERTAGRFCRERPVHLALAVAASFTAWAVLLFEYWALAFFLGVTLSPSELVIGLAAARVAYLLLFPAGLGVLEAGQVAAIRALGLPAALGLSLSLVIRLRDVIVASAGLWWGLRMLTRGETRETTRSRSSTASTSGGRGISRTR